MLPSGLIDESHKVRDHHPDQHPIDKLLRGSLRLEETVADGQQDEDQAGPGLDPGNAIFVFHGFLRNFCFDRISI